MKIMREFRIFVFLFCLVGSLRNSHAQVAITELMQSNIDCVMDDRNEFPDSWVELFNTSSSSVNLNEYSIGLTADVNAAWHLPNKTLAPRSYILVYCDKEATSLHTDFRLESGKGGAVYLFHKSKVECNVLDIPKQPTPGISYTRYITTDGAEQWAYACAPTPNGENTSPAALGILPEPIISLAAGVYNKQQVAEISLPEGVPAGTVICYTKDGTEPTKSSPIYTQPLAIIRPIPLRARLFCDGWASPQSTVQSFILPDHKTTLPIVSIVTDSRYLNDSKIGIYTEGNYNSKKKNYEYDWRRPMHIEIFEPDLEGSPSGSFPTYDLALSQLCEARVMGAASRGNVLKSLALYANKRFGQKRFDYQFFPDQRPGEPRYKSFLLRNAGNDFDYLYMRDAIIQRTMGSHVDIDWQAWRPAIVYINGTYKGLLNFRDRSNDDNIYTYYDGLEDIDIVKNGYELQHGTWDHFNAFKAFYNEHGHTWDEYSKWLDLDEYINVMALNLYYGNVDFPGNNIVFWRPRTDDGRWRIIVKDTDYALGIYDMPNSYNMIQWINNADHDGSHNWANQWDHTRLFRRLMEDQTFRTTFLERCAIYMGDFMNERGTRATWDAMYELIKDEYPVHRALINKWWPNYSDELSKARRWLSGRTDTHYNHLAEYYGTGKLNNLVINHTLSTSVLQGLRVTFNGVQLSESTFNGKFFCGSEIHLSGRPALPDDIDDYHRMRLCATGSLTGVFDSPMPHEVKGWKVVTIGTNGSQNTTYYDGSEITLTMPSCACLQISAITEEATAIDELLVDGAGQSESESTTIYDLQGRLSNGSRPSGIYITGNRKKVVIR